MRKFTFTWQAKEKYGTPPTRTNNIQIGGTSNFNADAKTAVDVFYKSFGNQKKNDILSIQEVDKDGVAVGDPILPREETTIVPELTQADIDARNKATEAVGETTLETE